jgi:hypothetical protein
MQCSAVANNAKHYAKLVHQAAIRRHLKNEAIELIRNAHDDAFDLSSVPARFNSLIQHIGIDENMNGRGPVLINLGEVHPEPLAWLWPGRIASGKLTLLASDPGLGKSLISLDMAARVTQCMKWPDIDEPAPLGGVVLLSAEDDPADTIVPRLKAAGADVSRVNLITGVKWSDPDNGDCGTASFSLCRDITALEKAIEATADCKLVVVDPISAYLGGTDSHKNCEVRSLLVPLSEIAQRNRVAVLAITHLNKGGGPAIYRSMGSLAFVAAARASWAIVKDQDNPIRRLFLPVKNNLAADSSGLAYVVKSIDGAPVIAWEREPVHLDVNEVLSTQLFDPQRGDRQEVIKWLREILANGPMEATEVMRLAGQEGISKATLMRAKRDAGIVSVREGFGKGSVCKWALPDHYRESTDP